MPLLRLNKILSQAGAASRRLADELIQNGRVEVNGTVVSELGAKANPAADDIRVDGRRLKMDTERRYLLMNKPKGVLSTRSDPHRRKTVIDVLSAAGVKGYFYPVGRLDYDSEGLILLTNDGEFAERVTHPRYELERTYEAVVAGVPDERDIERLRRGVTIEGKRTLPATVFLTRVTDGRGGPQAVLELTLREGRNRQVRHMCSAIAHPVDRLKRIQIGGLTDRNLRPGQIRDLTEDEVKALMSPEANAPMRPLPTERIARPATGGKSEAAKPERLARTEPDRRGPKPPKPGVRRPAPRGAAPRSAAPHAKAPWREGQGRPPAAGRPGRGTPRAAAARRDAPGAARETPTRRNKPAPRGKEPGRDNTPPRGPSDRPAPRTSHARPDGRGKPTLQGRPDRRGNTGPRPSAGRRAPAGPRPNRKRSR
jgi:23S rRNA pseudouridine2605 synthase